MMLHKHTFVSLAGAVGRALDRLAQWSVPGTDGRVVELGTVEEVVTEELAEWVKTQGGDAERWRKGIV